MISRWKKRRAAGRLKPGDGHELKPYRWWQPFTRTLLHIRIKAKEGQDQTWSVDMQLWGDSNGEVWAKLYSDGRHRASSKLPAVFSVPGGNVEIETSGFGLKRCHYVTEDGLEYQLTPDSGSAEGRRAQLSRKHPVVSRVLGLVSIIILIIAIILGVPQVIEQISQIPPIAENIGTFTSPFKFPAWFNVSLVIAALVASTERALRLRYSELLDGTAGMFSG